MRDEILNNFKARHPDLKKKSADTYVDRYIQVMLREIAYSLANYPMTNDEFPLAINSMRDDVKKVLIAGKQQWALHLLLMHSDTSLVITNFKGQKGKNSRVSLNPIYEKAIMEQLINLNYELSTKRIAELQEKAQMFWHVDPDSLDDFIKRTSERYAEVVNDPTTKQAYKDALVKNLMIANQLRSQFELQDGRFIVREHWETVDSGRCYGKGLSLQRIPAKVRHAALGICHKYDFMACSYGLMTGLALEINPELKVADLTNYIKNRAPIRKRIADEIGISELWMKDIFTSLGFGASTADNPHRSIRRKLGSSTYEALMANREFKHIKQTIDRVRNTVADHFSSDDLSFKGMSYNCIDPNSDPVKPKKRSRNQKLAWIYQVMESQAISTFASMVKETGIELAMFAHDCLYFKQKLPRELMAEVMYQLNEEFPFLRVEHEEVIPIYSKGHSKSALMQEYQDMIDAHQLFLDAEEITVDQIPELDTLDPVLGYFAEEIKALNDRVTQDIGTSIQLAL